MAEHTDFGNMAEQLAEKHLVSQGYEILARNYRFQKAEIDLIALYDECIIIVEVKARSTDIFLEPHEAVTKGKIKLLVKAADHYLNINQIDREVRFDIISVLREKNGGLKLTHLEDAFQSFDAN